MADKNPQQYTNNNWGNQRQYQNLDANGNFIDDPEMILNNMWADSMNGQSGNVFHDWLFPQVKEGRQMAEEMFLTDRQNAYNSASAQMARAKAAGINPLTAAGGIAGNGTSSATDAPQPASSVNPLGDVAGAAGDVANASGSIASLPSQIKRNNAEAENLDAISDKTRTEIPFIPILSRGQNLKYFGDFVQSLKDVGIGEIQAGGIAFDLLNGGLQKSIDYLSMYSGLRNIDTQMKRVKAEYDLMQKDIDNYDIKLNANLSLMEQQGLQATAQAMKLKAETWFQEQMNMLERQVPGILTLPGGRFGFHLAFTKGVDSPEFQALENSAYRLSYKSALGGFDADKETAWERFKNQVEGSDSGKLTHAKSFADLENYKVLFSALADLYFGGTSTETGLITKIFNIVAQALHIPEEDFMRMFEDAYRPK